LHHKQCNLQSIWVPQPYAKLAQGGRL